MKSEKTKRSGNELNKLFSRLGAEKKKTVTALCLIGVMAFMWIRVLGGKAPKSAEAAPKRDEVTEGRSDSELKISFIELPKVKGRNDVLTRDFFAADGGRLSDIGKVSVVSRGGSAEAVRRVAEKLKLEAIRLGKNPQAFINDKLLSVGDKLLVRDGVNTYECEVIRIEETEVFIRCGESEIQLKLTQAVKNSG